jgi:ABC-type amino acid transport substrate-binding protein
MIKFGFLICLLCWNTVVCSEGSSVMPVLKVGTSADYPPFSFIDNGQPIGFDIDLVQEIGKRLHYTVEITDMPFKTLLPAVQLGTIDIIAAGLSDTPERAKQVSFLPPHLTGGVLVILTKGHVITQGVANLDGKDVIVNDGFTAAQYMQAFPAVNLQYLKSTVDAIAALSANRAFAFVTSKNALNDFFKHHPMAADFHVFPIKGTGEEASLAISKHNAKLFEEAKKALLEMKQDGTVEQLKQKWGVF